MASTSGLEAEFNDPRRKGLLEALKDALPTDTIRPTAWACLWLSDIDELKDLVAVTQAKPIFGKTLLEGVEVLARIVPTWTQRKRPSSATSTPQSPSTPSQLSSAQSSRGKKRNSSGQLVISRSKLQRDQCCQRDQRKCVLTNTGEPIEVAHIYPFSVRHEEDTVSQQTPSFWDTLRMFWSKERIDIWYGTIFSNPAKTEICQNLLCLSPDAHAYWERAYFALKPIRISDDKKRLDIQFFWLSKNLYVPGISILQAPALSALDHGPNLAKLYNHRTDSKICSGDEISLETDDPVIRPLPDFSLLEMQWFLHRVTAMSGAAVSQDDFHNRNSDNDFVLALRDRLEMCTEDDWNMEIDEVQATEHFEERRSLTQPSGVHTINHLVALCGGGEHREMEDNNGEEYEAENSGGEGRAEKGCEGEEQGSQ